MIELTLIIAVYNAKETIRSIAETAKLIPEIKEIILVDDGSTDGTKDVVKSIPGVRHIFHKVNLGEGSAIADGLKNRTYETVLLVDDDLRFLAPAHIRALIGAFVESGADMVIAARERPSPFDWFSGERIFKGKVVEPYYQVMATAGFGLEQIINYAHKGRKIKIIYSHGIGHPVKYFQYSWFQATKSYLIENWQMMKFFFWTKTNGKYPDLSR